ncbi:MAG: TatD family hydrolase [Deltaproteobacteria bacterium]|nr:TatD family hydrolase [Deltaproteobacteria bacterium]
MLVDSHCHLDMKDFDKDGEAVIGRARKEGIVHMISIGIDVKSSQSAIDLARRYAFISATVGCHPHDADECGPEDLQMLSRMTAEPEVVAWGEIGLDYYRNYSKKENQRKIFQTQLELAQTAKLPVIIHDRDAHEEVYATLEKMGKGERKGVIHCFSGDRDLAEAFIALGYYISIPGTVTYKKAIQIKEVAATIPLDRMLVETDAPFLAPVPRRGKRNEPSLVNHTAREIAKLREIPFETVAEQTTRNAGTLFGLPL